MTALFITLGIIVAALVFFAIYGIAVYNRLVTLRERYKNGYAQIDVQLKRRYDLIPNLVEAVKGYMTHERETLDRVISARNQAASANQQAAAHPENTANIRNVASAEGELTAVLSRLMIVQEAYPDLKADTQVSRLMEELTSTENRVAFARQHYNDNVMTYNAYRQSFPPIVVAGPAGFGQAELFEIHDVREREAVQVRLGDANPSAIASVQ